MQLIRHGKHSRLVLALILSAAVSQALAGDLDQDGVDDSVDNCAAFANTLQYDGDLDGIGNRCDPDFNNDGTVDDRDLDYMRSVFFQSDPHADLDANGTVDFADLAILKLYHGAPPGAPPPRWQRRGGGNAGQTDGIISINPNLISTTVEDTFSVEVWMDFTADPTIGGGFDVVFDNEKLQFQSWVAAPLGDPAFSRPPDLEPGLLRGFAIGDFDGLSGPALVGTLEFTALNLGLTDVTPTATTDPTVGPFVSIADFGAQVVEFLDALVDVARPPGPHISVAPTGLELGQVVVGDTSSGIVTVTSEGDQELLLGTVGDMDPLAAPFAFGLDDCSGQALPSGASCMVQVNFSPDAAMQFADSFNIASNALEGASIGVPVSGTGVPVPVPDIEIIPLNVDFGEVAFGDLDSVVISISNIGTAPLVLGDIAGIDPVEAPFTVTDDFCSNASLQPGNSCTVGLGFLPTVEGLATDSFDVPSNDPDEPSITAQLQGIGVRPVADDVFGYVGGIDPATLVICQNTTTGQRVTGIFLPGRPWNCSQLGLQANQGDAIVVFFGGHAK